MVRVRPRSLRHLGLRTLWSKRVWTILLYCGGRKRGGAATQQDFAFISDPPNSTAPEPGTTALIGGGLAVLFLKRFCVRRP